MNDFESKLRKSEIIDYDNLMDFDGETSTGLSNAVINSQSGAESVKNGIKVRDLQSAIDDYANELNKFAIAKSTGKPVKTPTQQYKGFAAEEYFKHTLKINALAKGVPNWKIGVYTFGDLPDGSNLSRTDMETDISVWTRNRPWDKPRQTVDYQSKMHNDPSLYAKDMSKSQYSDVEFVGGAGQGVNDTVTVKIGNKTVSSDTITPDEAAELSDQMKAQKAPKYPRAQEKKTELYKLNVKSAVKAGAMTGLIVSSIQEILSLIKHSSDMSEDQFARSMKNILCGTAEGGIRGGAITSSVQIFGKILGREVSALSLEAVPAMAVTNASVDFAKDMYRCFVRKSIDTDDLLCNTVKNSFLSVAGFGGTWAGIQSLGAFTSAKQSAAAGAAIGSAFGPIGTVIGSVIGGFLIGEGARVISNLSEKDGRKAFDECISKVDEYVYGTEIDRLYFFADKMESISDFKLSFKDLLPCYNLISDLTEYNLHKKALKAMLPQLQRNLDNIDAHKKELFREIENNHRERLQELREGFNIQRNTMIQDFKQSINTYVADSYISYADMYDVYHADVESLKSQFYDAHGRYSGILDVMRNKNDINAQINSVIHDLMSDNDDRKLLRPFIREVENYMRQDEIIAGKQYISSDEVEYMISSGANNRI